MKKQIWHADKNQEAQGPRTRRLIYIILLCGWLLYSLNDAFNKEQFSNPEVSMLLGIFLSFVAGIVTTLLLFYIYDRLKIEQYSYLKIVLFASLISPVAAVFRLFFDLLISIPLWGIELVDSVLSYPLAAYIDGLIFHSLIFMVWSIFYFGIHISIDLFIVRQRAEEERLKAKNAELQMLRYQLNPHFLFNSLSSLRYLISDNPKKAEEMVSKISQFLKFILTGNQSLKIPVNQDIQALKNYIEIEKFRYGSRLEVEFDIDPKAENFLIPVFLIHPVIENAIKYGMDTSQMPLRLHISIAGGENCITIKIRNSGTWVSKAKLMRPEGSGTGLKNVQNRLDHHFPNAYEFLIDKNDHDVCVTIVINSDKT